MCEVPTLADHHQESALCGAAGQGVWKRTRMALTLRSHQAEYAISI